MTVMTFNRKQLAEQQYVEEADKCSDEICNTMDALTKLKMQLDRSLDELVRKAQQTRDSMAGLSLVMPPVSVLPVTLTAGAAAASRR